MPSIKLSLRDKFLLSFLSLAIVLAGTLTLLATKASSLLPELSLSHTQRYEAQLVLRDMREAVLTSYLSENLSDRDAFIAALSRYERAMSITASPGVYEALVNVGQSMLVSEEEKALSAMHAAMRTYDIEIRSGNSTGAVLALETVLESTQTLEEVNAQVIVSLSQAGTMLQRYILTFFLISVAMLLLGITIFAQFLSSWITKPLRTLQQAAMRIADGDFTQEITSSSHDELGMLIKSFDHMRRKVLSSIEEVRAFAQRDEILINSIVDCIIAVDREGKIILFNAAACAATGWPAEEVIGKRLDEVLQLTNGDASHLDMLRSVIESGIAQSVLKTLELHGTKSEKITPVTVSVSPFIESEGMRGAVIVLRDVSENIELDKLREEFVSIASHQLRTPLTAIRWLLEKLIKSDQENMLNLDDKHRDTLNQAYARTLSMSELVSSLLALSRLDAQKVNAKLAPVSLQDLFEKLHISFKAAAEKKSITLTMQSDFTEPVHSDEVILTEVLANLVNNAIKYSKDNTTVTVRAYKEGERFAVDVADQGIGIPEDQRSSMFQKFFRAKNALTFTPEGTGIGLYMVKSFVELLGGDISFTSVTDKGTTFRVSFPNHASHA